MTISSSLLSPVLIERGVHCKLNSVIIHAMNALIKKIQQNLTIPDTYADCRLDQALAKLLCDYSRTQIKEWIDSGVLLVDGKTAKAKTKVKGGEQVSLQAEIVPTTDWEAEAIPLSIIYEDEALLIVNKPAGLVVHPGAGNSRHTLLNALLHHAPELALLPRAGILHRLDKDTSGLLLIAKTPQALKHLSLQLKKRTIVREYQAIVQGRLISGRSISAPLARHPRKRQQMTVIETGKEAITHYRVMERYRAYSRLKLKLETGRTHQIRVHMAYTKHPLIGDPVYGGRLQLVKGSSPELIAALRQFKRQALHAFHLAFTHPVTNETVSFECDLPADMQQLIEVLKTDSSSK